MALYMGLALLNLYRLMFPLSMFDIKSYPDYGLVRSLWDDKSKMSMKVYLSSRSRFQIDYLKGEYASDDDEEQFEVDDVSFLWEEDLSSASLSKSFLLTSLECGAPEDCRGDASYDYAERWLDDAEKKDGGNVLAELQAGQGIESTSVLLVLYNTISDQLSKLFSLVGLTSSSRQTGEEEESNEVIKPARSAIYIPKSSAIWYKLQSNATVFVHVVVVKDHATYTGRPNSLGEAQIALKRASQSHSLLTGKVDMIKYDAPNHLPTMGRLLYKDITYILASIVGLGGAEHPPWRMEFARPEQYRMHEKARDMKRAKAGYPYWKPEVSIKYVNDNEGYPVEFVGLSGMTVVGVPKNQYRTGYAMLPGLHVDEIGLTSEKYIPINETITSLPLRISFDRSDLEADQSAKTATAGGISPARWRLLTHLSKSLESQKELGFEDSDIDDLRRLIADTNITLLTITVLASGLHLLFEFLTFKNEVSFWRSNKDLTGLSVRSLFLDMIGQVIILLYLIEKDSSLLMTIPTACGCLIALWKCQRGAGLQFVPLSPSQARQPMEWWNLIPSAFGYALRATRLEIANSRANGEDKVSESNAQDLTALSIETDRIATRTLGSILLPVVLLYTLYSFIWEEHTGWYSWLITSASSAVYALGFVLMTPQLFLNYKLKSVAHLPWRVLVYKFLNTFIDDLFAFIIRMPTMARLSCFRDDIVFIIYLYQRWLYPVDTSRPVEGGGETTSHPSDEGTRVRKKKSD